MSAIESANTSVTSVLDPISLGKPLPSKIAIVGFADSKDEAPFADPSWEIWGVNDVYAHVPRVDRSFELHDTGSLVAQGRRNPAYEQWLREGRMPVYSFNPRPEYPTQLAFPGDQVMAAFGDYFTNSISWMTAFALLCLCEVKDGVMNARPGVELGLWGVDMAHECVSSETRVLTDDLRWVCAGDLRVGDGLLAFDENPSDGKYRRWRKATVTEAGEIMKPCYRVLLEDGTKMIASHDHPWLVHAENSCRWAETEKLVTSAHRRPTRAVKIIEPWDKEDSRDLGYLAAAFDGEGHLSQRDNAHCDTKTLRAGFAQRTNAMQANVERALHRYGFDFSKTAGDVSKYVIKGGRPETLRFLGQVRPERLLANFDADAVGVMRSKRNVAVLEAECIGEHPVIALGTTTKTFIAEGFAQHNTEYGAQRPSCEYYIGLARALGVKVYIPATSDLLKTGSLYGISTTVPMRIKMDKRIVKLTESLNQLNAQRQQLQMQLQMQVAQIEAQMNQVKGAIGAFKYTRGVWTNGTEVVPEITDHKRALGPAVQPSDGQIVIPVNQEGQVDIQGLMNQFDAQEKPIG